MFPEDSFVRFSVEAEDWGKLEFLRFLPPGQELLALIGGTPWEEVICHVSGEVLSMALYGRHMPLVRQLVNYSPEDLVRKLPGKAVLCTELKVCMIATNECKPGPELPECYLAPGATPEQSRIGSLLGKALRDGRYIIVVGEGEFVVP